MIGFWICFESRANRIMDRLNVVHERKESRMLPRLLTGLRRGMELLFARIQDMFEDGGYQKFGSGLN